MFAAAKTLQLVPKALVQNTTRSLQASGSVLSGPPRVHISPAEKLAHGLAIAVGMCVVPAWVLVNIKHYRGEEE